MAECNPAMTACCGKLARSEDLGKLFDIGFVEFEGLAHDAFAIGTDGRVRSCNVVGSSGSRSLDNATCRILRSRARFTPAKLSNGQPTTDTYSQTITWRLEG